MHPTQLEILDSLRQDNSPKKFSQLLRDVAETSDNLTYHLKQLQKIEFIESPGKGVYKLAEKGTIYLNNNLELQHDLFPTVSCMLELHDAAGKVLVMKKLKQPFLGKLHLLTFGVISSKSLRDQIQDFLQRYQINATDITFKCVYRQRIQQDEGQYIFDKFFVVFTGSFTAFKPETEDRQFSAEPLEVLRDLTRALPANGVVLDLPKDSGFTEKVLDDND